MLAANHGGGVHYSLCPANETLNEECFNAHPLAFASDNTTIRYIAGPLNGTEYHLPAKDATEGVFPLGSVWRRNPIPACNCDKGFACTYAGTYESGQIPYVKSYPCVVSSANRNL